MEGQVAVAAATRVALIVDDAKNTVIQQMEHDNSLLERALAERGLAARTVAWDDAAVDWSAFDLALLRTPYSYAGRWPEFEAWAKALEGSHGVRVLNPVPLLEWGSHRKYLCDECWKANRVPVVPTCVLTEDDSVCKVMERAGWETEMVVAVKPAKGHVASVESIRFAQDLELLDLRLRSEGLKDAMDEFTNQIVVQQFLAEVQTEGLLCAVVFSGKVSHVMRRLPEKGTNSHMCALLYYAPVDYNTSKSAAVIRLLRVDEDHGGSREQVDKASEPEVWDSVVKATQRVLAALPFALTQGRPLTYARLDFVPTAAKGLVLLDAQVVDPELFLEDVPSAMGALADAVEHQASLLSAETMEAEEPDNGRIPCYLIAHSIAKRHNLGTLARTATAFNVKEVCVVGARDFHAFGSHGAVDYVKMRHFRKLSEVRDYLKNERGCTILGIEIMDGAMSVTSHPFTGPTAFILGNEGDGLSEHQAAICDGFVYIPQYGPGTASLNVVVAAAVILHNFAVWAGYQERARDGVKFVVAPRPQRRARNVVAQDPEEVRQERMAKQVEEAARSEWVSEFDIFGNGEERNSSESTAENDGLLDLD